MRAWAGCYGSSRLGGNDHPKALVLKWDECPYQETLVPTQPGTLATCPLWHTLHNSFGMHVPLDRVTAVIQRQHPWQQRHGWNGGKDCNYLLTRFHISLLSGWFCFLIYFDLLEN